MKYLLFAIIIGLQGVGLSPALAWSPLEFYQTSVVPSFACQRLVASNDQEQDEEQEQDEAYEDEEPDCD